MGHLIFALTHMTDQTTMMIELVPWCLWHHIHSHGAAISIISHTAIYSLYSFILFPSNRFLKHVSAFRILHKPGSTCGAKLSRPSVCSPQVTWKTAPQEQKAVGEKPCPSENESIFWLHQGDLRLPLQCGKEAKTLVLCRSESKGSIRNGRNKQHLLNYLENRCNIQGSMYTFSKIWGKHSRFIMQGVLQH